MNVIRTSDRFTSQQLGGIHQRLKYIAERLLGPLLPDSQENKRCYQIYINIHFVYTLQ